jgi:ornithine--oxo-acid transaminase
VTSLGATGWRRWAATQTGKPVQLMEEEKLGIDEASAKFSELSQWRAISPVQEQMIKREERHGVHNYAPLPVVLSKGKGVWVWDEDGNKYIDCLSAYSAVNQGHCHPRIIQAFDEQIRKLTLTSRAFYNSFVAFYLT